MAWGIRDCDPKAGCYSGPWGVVLELLLPIALLLVAGCADHGGTRPIAPTQMSAMNISEDPVVAVSPIFTPVHAVGEPGQLPDSVFAIAVPSRAFGDFGRADDIHLTFLRLTSCRQDALVWNFRANGWNRVEKKYPGGCLAMQVWSAWLLTKLGRDPADEFIQMDTLYVQLVHAYLPSIRLVRYREDYQFVTVAGTLGVYGIGFNGREVWTIARTSDTVLADTNRIYVLDGTGTRLDSLVPDRRINGPIVWSGDAFWILNRYGPPVFSRINAGGIVDSAFASDEPFFRGVAWAEDHLWVVKDDEQGSELLGIDLRKSVDSGRAIIDRRSPMPRLRGYDAGMTSDGNSLLLGDNHRIYRVTFTGEILDTIFTPIDIRSLAWDGEAVWALHHGSITAPTEATLLSRFYVR